MSFIGELLKEFGRPTVAPKPPQQPEVKIDPEVALRQLIETDDIENCIRAYTSSTIGSPIEQLAADKIKKIARTLADWLKVYSSVSPTSSLGKYAFEQLQVVDQTFDDWKKILDAAEADSELEKRAASIVVSKAPADDPQAIAELLDYDVINDDDQLQKEVFAKLRSVAASAFGDWKSLYENTEDDDVKDIAREKMIAGIDSLERLKDVADTVDNDEQDDDAFSKPFRVKAKAILVTEEACRNVVKNYTAEGPLFETAFDWLLDAAKTVGDCLDIYISLKDDWKTESDDENDDLLEKTVAKIISIATKSELYIISRLGENTDDFDDLSSQAQSKLEKKD